ncbi:hypothetical protein BH09PLA1_BH09PLA1_15790 [soil metagenome]
MRFRLFVATLIITAASIAQADFVRNFDVVIKVQKDASLDVTETIDVVFESPRHGIYRFIPVRYSRHGNPFSIEFRLDSITDENGNALAYSRARQGRDISMKIGDKDVTITGPQTYKLHYVVRRAINFFGEAPELYWNATGDQWPYPIQNATATVIPPDGVSPDQVRTTSFVGPPGSTTPGEAIARSDSIVFSAGRVLPAGSGLTIVAGFPAGSVTKPSLAQELMWFISDWWPVAVFPAIAIGIVYFIWRRSGRDEGAGTQAVAVEFEPPKDLSPSEVGTLIDESCDTPDIIATLIDLAARGWLTITELPGKKILFLSSQDYEFTRIIPPPQNDVLKPHEKKFLDGLFEHGSSSTLLSEQKEKFYTNIDPIRKSIYSALMSKRMFRQHPEHVRNLWRGIGVAAFVLGVVLTVALDRHRAIGIGTILAGITFFASAGAMPARTLVGTRKLIECLSFQRFVSMVEKDRIKEMAMNDPTTFGRLLPYAMVLGVADQWAQAFAGLMTSPPDWYRSYDNRPFNSMFFMHTLGSSMRTMERTMTSQPRSSAGSGGSGFSGGGGGGGFGGGGGGSW